MDLQALDNIVKDEVLPAIERTEGVASATEFGGMENQISVEVNQAELEGYHLAMAQIVQALQMENISLPSGEVKKGEHDLIVRTVGEFQSISEIEGLPLTLPTKEVIHLGDVATVVEKPKVQSTVGRVNGAPAIGVSITRQTVANTVQVANRLEQVFADMEKNHPELTFTVAMNQADFINESILFVAESAILGCILAVFICLIFLRNLASTMIIAISIPTSIIATFILMFGTGFTMNMLSLSGLAVGIGMLVDDSIVVMENIYRRRHEGLVPMEASIHGAREVTMPVVAATLTKIAVFLPIVFVQGIAAAIFKEFAFTIGFALICSLVVALTVVPMLCSRLFKIENINYTIRMGKYDYHMQILPLFERGIDALIRVYTRGIKYALGHRKTIISVALILLVTSSLMVTVVGGELLPSSDSGALSIDVEFPYGASLEESDKVMAEVEQYVKEHVKGLENYSLSIGNTSAFASFGGGNSASLSVNLVNKRERTQTIEAVVAQIQEDLSGMAGVRVSVSVSSQMSMSMGGAGISVELSGDDLNTLDQISRDFLDIVQSVEGTSNVTRSLEEGNPEVRVTMNRQVSAQYGISSYQLSQALQSALSGARASVLKQDGAETDIMVSLTGDYGDSIENMRQVSIMTPTGTVVSVGDIADISLGNSPTQIVRQDQVRTVNVTAESLGRDLQSISNDMQRKFEAYQMPAGYTWKIGGESEEMMKSFSDLVMALLLSVLIIYMILAAQFESLIQPFIIMLAIPFALTGAFLILFLTNTPLSIVGFLGIIMLCGIVVNNSILLVDFINQNRSVYATRDEAIINAGRFRLRPIIMTMLTTCLGLLPLALGFGSGGELIAPMGITVIGGLTFSTLITLLLIPVIYAIIDERREKRRARRESRKALRRLGTTTPQAEKQGD
jgi:HAE1 family hydrophobic/amphiphilic exporter-1